MASTGPGGSLPPNFLLTPQQQSLLFAALNSNKQQASASPTDNALPISPSSIKNSPMQNVERANYQESPYLDNYDYDFGESSFDFSFSHGDQAKMIGDVPGSARSESTEGDSNDKRSHPDDEDDEDSPGNDPKRRESSDRIPKKPGRKPLTSEPTSKRKAQNRAAQRAFRERKERHLKDLETKVEELEKASEATNHENTKLRTQVERMTTELKQYKQKISLMSSSKALPRDKVPFGNAAVSNLNDVNFQFEFPKFGMLPGPPNSKQQQPQRSTSQPISPLQNIQVPSPARSQSNETMKSPQQPRQTLSDAQFKDELAKFSNIFTPSMTSSTANGSRASLDSGNMSMGASSSPSASSHSNMGASSSCGTSPEPFTQSPMGFKPVETMTTIGEEQASLSANEPGFAQFANVDLSNTNFDWLAQQNGGQFDPQLFGGYREPQENILSNPSFDDFFNDALDADFFTPYNTAPSPNGTKKNLIDEIDAKKNDDEPKDPSMNCTQIWEKLQACPKAQTGEFDLDGLCSELTKKAKCSGTGPVVGETDFDSILSKYMGKDVSANCMAEKLGIEVERSQGSVDGLSLP
jgi:AP-1-like factor